jgi:DNA-binding XRE family transcriptional regulator
MRQLQTIRNIHGTVEYVLLPIVVYEKLHESINLMLEKSNSEYIDFNPADFIKNPIALKRMQAQLTQTALAKQLKVSQAYISKIEQDDYKITPSIFKNICEAIDTLGKSEKRKNK